jgi:surface polysaccharide O-acyltransferase-like enzyme
MHAFQQLKRLSGFRHGDLSLVTDARDKAEAILLLCVPKLLTVKKLHQARNVRTSWCFVRSELQMLEVGTKEKRISIPLPVVISENLKLHNCSKEKKMFMIYYIKIPQYIL